MDLPEEEPQDRAALCQTDPLQGRLGELVEADKFLSHEDENRLNGLQVLKMMRTTFWRQKINGYRSSLKNRRSGFESCQGMCHLEKKLLLNNH
jgi:hypothetical protein